jgi:hypothetical protein
VCSSRSRAQLSDVVNFEPGTDRAVWDGPDEHIIFRVSQLVLLLSIAAEENATIASIDRLAYYDFFAANPYVVLDGASPDKDASDRISLLLSGFQEGQLSYGGVGQRFASRRQRIKHDLSILISYGLAEIDQDGYGASAAGLRHAESLSTVYADAYRASARIVLRRLTRLSEKRLTSAVHAWLGKSWLLLDFLDDVRDPESTQENEEANSVIH